jgi:hypothetical protein
MKFYRISNNEIETKSRVLASNIELVEKEVLESVDFSNEFIDAGRAYLKGITEKDVDPHQLSIGIKIEMEHTTNPHVALRIALDHLAEFSTYYTGLQQMEEQLRQIEGKETEKNQNSQNDNYNN